MQVLCARYSDEEFFQVRCKGLYRISPVMLYTSIEIGMAMLAVLHFMIIFGISNVLTSESYLYLIKEN